MAVSIASRNVCETRGLPLGEFARAKAFTWRLLVNEGIIFCILKLLVRERVSAINVMREWMKNDPITRENTQVCFAAMAGKPGADMAGISGKLLGNHGVRT